MIHALRNVFIYIGIYTSIAIIWRIYELIRYKELKPNDKDVLITILIAGILWIWFKI